MALTLRPYQTDIIDRTRLALRRARRVLVQLATGGGKTALSTQMLQTVSAKQAPSMFLVHRQELVDQTMRTFAEFDLPYGVISAGYTPDARALIQIASIDTLRARLKSGGAHMIRKPRFIVVDEAHHAAAGGWAWVLQQFPDAQQVGLTATPERLDGKPLREYFDDMVQGPPVADLMAQGYLSQYRAFIPSSPDLSGVHTQMGDYVKGEVENVMDRPSITGDAISHYLKLAHGKRALAFCVSVKHSQHVVEQFNQAGIVAWHLDGNTNRGKRREAILAFRRGEIKVLSNVDLFGEGFDVPAADCSIMLRPTRSLALFLQQCGRVLRPMEGKGAAVLLDHAGNIARHGLPCDPREWSLDGRPKGKKNETPVVAIKKCPKCLGDHPAGRPHCPFCGFAYEKKGRQVDYVEGVLQEVDVKALQAKRIQENRKARSLEELIELGRARGYQKPEKWAAHYWTARVAAARNRGAL